MFTLVSVVLVFALFMFWYIIWLLTGCNFSMVSDHKETAEQRETREYREEVETYYDCKNNKLLRLQYDNESQTATYEPSVNIGLATAETGARRDEENAHPGYSWVRDHRPYWFAAIQFLLTQILVWPIIGVTLPIGIELSGEIIITVSLSVLGFVTAMLFWIGFYIVPPNSRVGIERLGWQLPGSLGEGPQFLLFFETPERASLRIFVWGPHSQNVANEGVDAIHMPGILEASVTPGPGVTNVFLLGRWPMKIITTVTMKIRARPWAWWLYFVLQTRKEEIGEAIASTVASILSTLISEINLRYQLPTNADPKTIATRSGEAFHVAETAVPESSATILLKLQRQADLRPIHFYQVNIATVTPGPELLSLMQTTDRAFADLQIKYFAGQGRKLNLQASKELIEEVWKDAKTPLTPEEKMNRLERLEELGVTRDAYGNKSGLEALLNALSLKHIGDTTKPKE